MRRPAPSLPASELRHVRIEACHPDVTAHQRERIRRRLQGALGRPVHHYAALAAAEIEVRHNGC